MPYESMNLLEFQRRFNSEEACLKAIFDARWPKGFICVYCHHNDGIRMARRRTIQCCVCRRQVSITSGTVFHRSKVPLTTWFWLIYLMSQDKGGISTMRAAKLLGMHYTTVYNMMHKVRAAMQNRQENILLSGLVEVDDAFFGGRSRGKSDGRSVTRSKSA
ncbi:MAG: IS1595 family transposase [Candidatus Melainabacteria bacterium]|nr:MAG: IS1595 family transposase [Candidatus Melainabacteria bacterium]QQR55977.1 MAG: IS1595 family transposase [Candidatus Melainabacteria bacterium]